MASAFVVVIIVIVIIVVVVIVVVVLLCFPRLLNRLVIWEERWEAPRFWLELDQDAMFGRKHDWSSLGHVKIKVHK